MGAATALVAVLSAALAAGSSAAPPPAELRDCRSRAESRAPVRMTVGPRDVRLGPLVLGQIRSPAGAGRSADPTWSYVKKAPVLLPARSRVVLAVAPEAAQLAAFQHRGGWTQAVRFTACFERVPAWAYRGTVGGTTFFPFALGLRDRSLCLPLELWVDGRTEPIRRLVPVGRPGC